MDHAEERTLQQGLYPVFLDCFVDLFDVYCIFRDHGGYPSYTVPRAGHGQVAQSDRDAGEQIKTYFRLLRFPDHNPACLMPPGFGPLEGALVTPLISSVSTTQLLDAS